MGQAYKVVVFDIEGREEVNGKLAFKKLTPTDALPPFPEGGNDVILVTSGRVPHWRHALACLEAIDTDLFGAVAVRDPVLMGAVVIDSVIEGLEIGDVVPV